MVHVPVLLEETVSRLVTAPGGWFVDGTVGAGGHSVALLAAAGLDARLLAPVSYTHLDVYKRQSPLSFSRNG